MIFKRDPRKRKLASHTKPDGPRLRNHVDGQDEPGHDDCRYRKRPAASTMRLVIRHADAVSVVVVAPARALALIRRRRGGADHRARRRADRGPRQRPPALPCEDSRTDRAPVPPPRTPPARASAAAESGRPKPTRRRPAPAKGPTFFHGNVSPVRHSLAVKARPSRKDRPSVAAGAVQTGQPARSRPHTPTN